MSENLECKLIFETTGEEFTLNEGDPIAEICEEQGVPFACTEGVCGTCVIEVIEGEENLTEQTQEEEDFLGPGVKDERLACQCRMKKGEVKVRF